jgi:hypothetical protein
MTVPDQQAKDSGERRIEREFLLQAGAAGVLFVAERYIEYSQIRERVV